MCLLTIARGVSTLPSRAGLVESDLSQAQALLNPEHAEFAQNSDRRSHLIQHLHHNRVVLGHTGSTDPRPVNEAQL